MRGELQSSEDTMERASPLHRLLSTMGGDPNSPECHTASRDPGRTLAA